LLVGRLITDDGNQEKMTDEDAHLVDNGVIMGIGDDAAGHGVLGR
jgi:hypothetical protein